MIKLILGLMAVGAIVLGVIYFRSYASFDPTAQGEKAKAAVRPGMTWSAVVDAAGKPQKYRTMLHFTEKVGGEQVDTIKPGVQLDFDRPLFEQEIKSKTMPDGFIFEYNFSHQAAFAVHFDGTATVTGVEDLRTMADLLDTRRP